MNKFVLNNWYKMAIAFSSITFSTAFLIYSLKNNAVQASPHFKKEVKDGGQSSYNHVVALPNGKIYGVRYGTWGWEAEFLTSVSVTQ